MAQKSLVPNRQDLTELVSDAIPFGFLVADELDRIVLVNPHAERLLGFSEQELLQQSLGDMIPEARETAQPCTSSQHNDAVSGSVNGRQSPVSHFRRQLTLTAKDGSEFFADVNFASLRRFGQRWSVVSIDCLAEENKPPQVTRLEAISEMVHGLAHECRNALQRARGCLDLLELDLDKQPQLLSLTDRIRTSLEDLQRNYMEVQEYAAPIVLEKRHCNARDIVRQAYSELESKHANLGNLELSGSDYEFENRVDANRMKSVFFNLLENASHASREGTPIHVRAALLTYDGCVWQVIEVCDQGDGIDRKVRDRIFNPFFTTKQKGNGLGLAICKRIVEAHGGEIVAAEDEDCDGACIRIVLPWIDPNSSDTKLIEAKTNKSDQELSEANPPNSAR
jgi:PAS domain S-box-containing protein